MNVTNKLSGFAFIGRQQQRREDRRGGEEVGSGWT